MKTIHFKSLLLFLVFQVAINPIFSQTQVGNDIDGQEFGEKSGFSVSMSADGKRVAVGSPLHSANNTLSGHVKVYDWIDGDWVQVGNTLTGEGVTQSFGYSISISADGQRLAIGAPLNNEIGENAGHVRVFDWQNGSWTQIGTDIDGVEANELFGDAVALSDNGQRLIVGASQHYHNGLKAGEIRMFEFVNQNWEQIGQSIPGEDEFDYWGERVDISGDGSRIISRSIWNDNSSGISVGQVKVYEWTGSSWAQMGPELEGDEFADKNGYGISISSNGMRIAIGAVGHDGNGDGAGRAQIFEWNGSQWQQIGNDIFGAYPGDLLGFSLSLDVDGNRLVISSPNNDENGDQAGLVSVYEWDGEYWLQVGTSILGEDVEDSCGRGVDISADGRTFIHGAQWNDGVASLTGHARVFFCGGRIYSGKVVWDTGSDCLFNPQEVGVPQIPVYFQKDVATYPGLTQSSGYYHIYLDEGNYVATVNTDVWPYFDACPEEQFIEVDPSVPPMSNINFMLEKIVECPYLNVEITSPSLRRCSVGIYYVDYCNQGSIAANDAYIEIALDPYVNYISSSIPLASQSGNILQFNVGNLAVRDCGSFTIEFEVDCDSEPGQIHCTEAHIYPDEICLGSIPNISVEQSCEQDEVQYKVTNLADAFPNPLQYLILADSIIIDTGWLNLDSGIDINVSANLLAGASSYQFVLGLNAPGYYLATPVHVCDAGAVPFNLTFLPETPQVYQDYDCQLNVGSYDPNDKRSTPAGLGEEQIIVPNSRLEYMIRFQNIGTDAAYAVHIYDTLSHFLAPETFKYGQASHDYAVEFLDRSDDGRAVLHFAFDPIYLPDSTSNPAGSQGFVTFQMDMAQDIPLGTVIENTSSIYFDYNDPVHTNTSWVTVDLIETEIVNATNSIIEDSNISLFPNPTNGDVEIHFPESPYRIKEVIAWDIIGKPARIDYSISANTLQLKILGQPGLYLLDIQLDNQKRYLLKVVKK